ncbi:hypothetical protein ACN08Z_05640, partial [Rothia sp. P7181]|uniref:hypothetical protein n=1 Tax=Rothia sp. P7181 TaxID=3402663 RepID=UPI003AE5F415
MGYIPYEIKNEIRLVKNNICWLKNNILRIFEKLFLFCGLMPIVVYGMLTPVHVLFSFIVFLNKHGSVINYVLILLWMILFSFIFLFPIYILFYRF